MDRAQFLVAALERLHPISAATSLSLDSGYPLPSWTRPQVAEIATVAH